MEFTVTCEKMAFKQITYTRYLDGLKYVYCAGNPLRYIDPTGMIVEPTDDVQVNNRINPNHKDYNQAFHENYKKLDADQNAIYSFNRIKPIRGENSTMYGYVTSNGKNEKGQDLISINYSYGSTVYMSNEAPLLEETFHATQYMKGDIGFQLQDGVYRAFAVDFYDEAEAQVFAAQNSKGIGTPMERALLKAYNTTGEMKDAVNFMILRTGKQGYEGLSKDRINAETIFKQYYKRDPAYNSNGTSAESGIIMRKPNKP